MLRTYRISFEKEAPATNQVLFSLREFLPRVVCELDSDGTSVRETSSTREAYEETGLGRGEPVALGGNIGAAIVEAAGIDPAKTAKMQDAALGILTDVGSITSVIAVLVNAIAQKINPPAK